MFCFYSPINPVDVFATLVHLYSLRVNIEDLHLEVSIFIGNKKGVAGLPSSFDCMHSIKEGKINVKLWEEDYEMFERRVCRTDECCLSKGP